MSGRRSTKQKRSAWRRRAQELHTKLERVQDMPELKERTARRLALIRSLVAVYAKLGVRP